MSRFSYKNEVHKLSNDLFGLRLKCAELDAQLELAVLVAAYAFWPAPTGIATALDAELMRQTKALNGCIRRCAAGRPTRELEVLVEKLRLLRQPEPQAT